MLELIIGQIPEAIYFSLFMIYAKGLKDKRILFTVLMVAEYILLTRIFIFNIYFQILYTFMSYMILKLLYKEKAQIIDIFLLGVSILILGLFSVPFLFLTNYIGNIYITCIISKIFLFTFLYIIKDKIYSLYKKVCHLWNRNDFERRKIKSLTLRNICMVIFNIMFFIMNIVILFAEQIGGV